MTKNVLEWLEETTYKFPDKIIFNEDINCISYSKFVKESKNVACRLVELGIYRKPVVVYLKKGIKCLVGMFGSVYSGNYYTPIDDKMPIERIKKIVLTLNPACVITDSEGIAKCSKWNLDVNILNIDVLIGCDNKMKILPWEGTIDRDILYVLFTSGSTGIPKGVAIRHQSVIDYIDNIVDLVHFDCNTLLCSQAPFYFDNSILDIYVTIKVGGTLYIPDDTAFIQPKILMDYLYYNRINSIFWVPSAMAMLARTNALATHDLSENLKNILFCGEIMQTKYLNIWKKYIPHAQYINLYGPTEITDACTYYLVNRSFSDNDSLPIGFPFPNTEIYVINDDNELVTNEYEGEGELYVRGTGVAAGYYNDLIKTNEVFIQNPFTPQYEDKVYRTGDIVKFNCYGELEFVGRRDSQIKYSGFRIELGEIEKALLNFNNISECCCLFDSEKNKIIAVIDKNYSKKELNEFLQSLLPKYMLPHKVVYMENLPKNTSGKLDRKKIKEGLI